MANLMAGRSEAANLQVSAAVPGPPPSQPSVINSPANNSTKAAYPSIISGTCEIQLPHHTVKIYSNGQFIGSGECSVGGTFNILVSLFLGENKIFARTFSFLEEEGPASQQHTLYLVIPAPVATPDTEPPASQPQQEQFRIIPNETWISFGLNKPVSLSLTIYEGASPFAINVDWGDGTHQLLVEKSHNLTLEHTYSKLGSYTILIKVVDENGQQATLQIAASSGRKLALNLASANKYKPTDISKVSGVFWVTYTLATVATISFWAGERYELQLNKGKKGLPKSGH